MLVDHDSAIFGNEGMKNRTQIYWFSQFGGWGLFVLGNILSASIQEQPFQGIYLLSCFILLAGLITTHAFRSLVHRFGWKKLNIPQLIPRMLVSAVVMSAVFTTVNTLLTDLVSGHSSFFKQEGYINFWQNILNFSALFLVWQIIYFAVNTFENWKREEILNLELRASQTEIELNSLKAQMNPHFVFNCMNSIRALVDENPEKAKQAITMLSGILRNNLTQSRFQVIPLSDELDLVEKYLALEKIRFEERLLVHIDTDPDIVGFTIPPFVIQTIAENAVKHGIAKRVEGGVVAIKTTRRQDSFEVSITNTGVYFENNRNEGIGLANTKTRLQMIYGNEASIFLLPGDDSVEVKITIPIKKDKHENAHH